MNERDRSYAPDWAEPLAPRMARPKAKKSSDWGPASDRIIADVNELIWEGAGEPQGPRAREAMSHLMRDAQVIVGGERIMINNASFDSFMRQQDSLPLVPQCETCSFVVVDRVGQPGWMSDWFAAWFSPVPVTRQRTEEVCRVCGGVRP